MSTNFLKLLKPSANLSHNGFDLSQKHVFSSKPGMLTPVLCVETTPNEKHEIDLAALTRTRTMDTAAFIRGKFRWDFFFVPYVQLWHPFDQFITQRDDKHSTRQRGHRYCPVIGLDAILTFIVNQVFLIYKAEYDDDEHLEFVDVHSHAMVYDAVRLLDMLGYGDYRWIIEWADRAQGAMTADLQQAINQYRGHYVNVFRLAAYQHIFYDFYRNKYWDVETTGGDGIVTSSEAYSRSYLNYFNFDDLECSVFGNNLVCDAQSAAGDIAHSNADLLRLAGMLTMRYSQYKKDLFTASLPSQQFGAVSTVDINGELSFKDGGSTWAQDKANVRIPAVLKYGVSNPRHLQAVEPPVATSTAFNGIWSIPSAFDVLQVRKAEALQAWKQNALRAGNMTDDAFRAHYGVSPYYYSDNNVNYLGSYESALDVNSVEATAGTNQTGNGKVGDIAATGTSITKGKKIRFDPRDFGVIMCIEHFVPDVEYRSTMIDKANRLYEDFDFFTSEFQNIGLDPIQNVDFDARLDYVNPNDVLGYAPRYWQYKLALDKCHGEFSRDGSMQNWVAPRLGSLTTTPLGERSLSEFYVRRDFLDKIFGIATNNMQDTDTFIHNVFFDVKSIRPMSVLGLPQF